MQYVVKIILFLAPRLQLRLVLRQQRNSSTANRGQRTVCVSKAGQFGISINDRVNVNVFSQLAFNVHESNGANFFYNHWLRLGGCPRLCVNTALGVTIQ